MAVEKTYKDLLQFPIIHGRFICNEVLTNVAIKEKQVTISSDIQILTVCNQSSLGQSVIDQVNFANTKVHTIVIDEFVKWISKIQSLKEYIEANYDNLPKYILYLDAFDCLILQDIIHPQEYLDFYNCKMLFNVEGNFTHTGFPEPTSRYFEPLYNIEAQRYSKLNEKKYGVAHQCGLNAGVFLGEKEFTLKILTEALNYMLDDCNKGFPFGCLDDQCLLRFIHNEHYGDISVDLFNKLSFWGSSLTFEDFSSENVFGIGYTQKYLKQYSNGKY